MYTKYFYNTNLAIGHDELAKFVNENNIGKEDIVSITQHKDCYTIFYYA